MTFQAFNTMEEMHAHLREAEAAANGRATDENKKVVGGSYAMSFDTASGLLVFGKVMTVDEIVAAEAKFNDPYVNLEDVRNHYQSSYDRGYRFANWYSAWVTEGELGDNHISVLLPITEEEYEQAFLEGFSVDAIMQYAWAQERLLKELEGQI